MFDQILVPLDGSQLSECVLPHAIRMAQTYNSEITLLRILEKTQSNVSAQLFDLLNWQINKTKSALYLEQTKSRFQKLNIQFRTAVLEGLVAEGITNYAQNQDIKLIILSSHGRNGLTQWGISSITQKIVLSAPTSLLIVRAHQQDVLAEELTEPYLYRNILVPLDGSQRAEHVLPSVMQLASIGKPTIHLVHVVQTPVLCAQMPPAHEDIDLTSRINARYSEQAGQYLEQVKARLFLQGSNVETHLISSGHTVEALHQIVEQEQIDLITLSAHGYSAKHQWPYGSVVSNFILYSKVSLLIVQDMPSKQVQKPIEISSRERSEL